MKFDRSYSILNSIGQGGESVGSSSRKLWLGGLALCIVLVVLRGFAADPPTASGLTAYVKKQVGNAYILGAYGQISTKNFRYGRAELYPEAAELIHRWGDAWDGLPAFDCIGLLKAYAQMSGAAVSIEGVNVTTAWRDWLSEWGPIQGATLQPGMAVFRVEGPRMRVLHVGIYVGDGMVVHARGTRWGVILEPLPSVFTYWGRLNWLSYDTAPDPAPLVTGVFLDVGSRAVVESDDAKPVTVSPIPHESGKLRHSIGYFADGAILTVLEVPDEISRLVEGIGTQGQALKGYVRTTELREATP